jgi:hypothetical protein
MKEKSFEVKEARELLLEREGAKRYIRFPNIGKIDIILIA